MTEGEVNYSNVIIATGCDNINSKTQNYGAPDRRFRDTRRRQTFRYVYGLPLRPYELNRPPPTGT
jgi:hypothetical protein